MQAAAVVRAEASEGGAGAGGGIIPDVTRHNATWLLTLVVLVGAAACSDTADLEGRIATLEQELASRPAIGDLIVVGKEVNMVGTGGANVCVRYRAFDSVEETCLLGVISAAPAAAAFNAAVETCYDEAKVGEPLPDSCR